MSRGVWAGSRVQRIVESMTIGACESAKQIADRMQMDYDVVWSSLYQRAGCVKDVEKVPGGFRRIKVIAPAARKNDRGADGTLSSVKVRQARARMPQMPASHMPEIVAPRTPPPFRPWQPGAAASPLRPGADDYRRVPSLYGEERIAYAGARPASTTASGAGACSGVK